MSILKKSVIVLLAAFVIVGNVVLTIRFLSSIEARFSNFAQNQTSSNTIHGWQVSPSRFQEQCLKAKCADIYNNRTATGDWRTLEQFFEDAAKLSRNPAFNFRNILLVIQFNDPHYESAGLIYELYSRIFAKVVFCGHAESIDEFWPIDMKHRKLPVVGLPENVSFAMMGHPLKHNGQNCYICVDRALKNDPRADLYDGVVMAADDAILNFWKWPDTGLSLQKAWLMSDWPLNKQVFEIDNQGFCLLETQSNEADCSRLYWNWCWADDYAENVVSFWEELLWLSEGTSADADQWKELRQGLEISTRGSRRMLRGFSDIFYIPQKYLPKVRRLHRLLDKHGVFCEIGSPSSIRAVVPPEDIQLLNATLAHDFGPGNIRNKPIADAFTTEYEFLHPFKLSSVFKDLIASYSVPSINAQGRGPWA